MKHFLAKVFKRSAWKNLNIWYSLISTSGIILKWRNLMKFRAEKKCLKVIWVNPWFCVAFPPLLTFYSAIFLILSLRIYYLILYLKIIFFLVAGFTREPDSNSERLRRASLYVSLAGYLCGIILISIILIVAFAHKGSDIYVRPPGEESGKFWISQAWLTWKHSKIIKIASMFSDWRIICKWWTFINNLMDHFWSFLYKYIFIK